jgi:uncharacterized caspase-like protein
MMGSLNAERKALIIANSIYDKVTLNNAIADADSVQAVLQRMDYRVNRHNNLSISGFIAAVDSFATKLSANDEAVVYYSGHGTNFGGVNYLVPTRTNLGLTQIFSKTSYSLNTLANKIKHARSSIIILEASKTWGTSTAKAVSKPFVSMSAASPKQVIFSAASPNKSVQNTQLPYSAFTKALLDRITSSGEGINTIFPQVVTDIRTLSGGTQVPWLSGTIEGDYYFMNEAMLIQWRKQPHKILQGGGSMSW